MNYLLTLSRNDFRITFRDPIFRVLLVFPLIAFALIRFVYPWIATRFPEVTDYGHVVLMWACMQTATMFGFIYGFLFLEEKDEQVDAVVRVLPVSMFRLLTGRLAMGYSFSVLTSFLILQFGKIAVLHPLHSLLIAAQYGLIGPLLALYLGLAAKNKIEGMAQMKLANLVLNVPILIYFLPYKVTHVTAAAPTYWSFRSLEAALSGSGFWVYFAVGCIFYTVLILWMLGRMERAA